MWSHTIRVCAHTDTPGHRQARQSDRQTREITLNFSDCVVVGAKREGMCRRVDVVRTSVLNAAFYIFASICDIDADYFEYIHTVIFPANHRHATLQQMLLVYGIIYQPEIIL